MKEIIPMEMSNIILRSNGMQILSPEIPCTYRYFIGKGNNGALVKNVLKNRGYWTKADSKYNAHFVWT